MTGKKPQHTQNKISTPQSKLCTKNKSEFEEPKLNKVHLFTLVVRRFCILVSQFVKFSIINDLKILIKKPPLF